MHTECPDPQCCRCGVATSFVFGPVIKAPFSPALICAKPQVVWPGAQASSRYASTAEITRAMVTIRYFFAKRSQSQPVHPGTRLVSPSLLVPLVTHPFLGIAWTGSLPRPANRLRPPIGPFTLYVALAGTQSASPTGTPGTVGPRSIGWKFVL